MGQTLENSIYLPDEGETNCYSGLASNWRALDTLKGSYSLHAINVDIHVTAAEKEAWNGKADASALTAHTGDTTIHVTAEDKGAWNNHVADTVKHVTAEDKAKWDAVTSKADDSAVVHKNGDETIAGQKLFNDINAISSSSEIGVSGGNNSFKVLDKNKKILARIDGGTYSSGAAYSTWLVNNGSDVFNGVSLYQPSANLAQLRPISSTLSLQLGSSSRSFSDCYTSKINGVEPSSLSLPSGNFNDVIDISSYITDLSGGINEYTAPANGWITITCLGCTGITLSIRNFMANGGYRENPNQISSMIPIRKNQKVGIYIYGSSPTVQTARFIPCQGNV